MPKLPGTTRRRPGQIMVQLPVIDDTWDEQTENAVAIRTRPGSKANARTRSQTQAHRIPELRLVSVVFLHHDSCPVTELLDPRETKPVGTFSELVAVAVTGLTT